MTALDVLIPAIALAVGALVTAVVLLRRRRIAPAPERVLLPFTGRHDGPALHAALRLARAEHATLMPAYLATVPMQLALEAPIGTSCDSAFDAFDAIERLAAGQGVPVDARIARGRNVRHALRQLFLEVPDAGRVLLDADAIGPEDIAWVLEHAPGEVVILRALRAPGSRPPDRSARSAAARSCA